MALQLTANSLVPLAAVIGASALAALAPSRTRRIPAHTDELTRRRPARRGSVTTGRHRAVRTARRARLPH